jgi:hypothetical protein
VTDGAARRSSRDRDMIYLCSAAYSRDDIEYRSAFRMTGSTRDGRFGPPPAASP